MKTTVLKKVFCISLNLPCAVLTRVAWEDGKSEGGSAAAQAVREGQMGM